jgi:hypothetical protein
MRSLSITASANQTMSKKQQVAASARGGALKQTYKTYLNKKKYCFYYFGVFLKEGQWQT